MHQRDRTIGEGARPGRSVFWKVAGVLIGVQVVTGVLAIALTAWFAYDRSLTLVANGIRLRMDALAEEIEQRAAPVDAISSKLPLPLERDLTARFPDPLILVSPEGEPVDTFVSSSRPEAPVGSLPSPEEIESLLLEGQVVVQLEGVDSKETWALAPLYDTDGLLAGGIIVAPLEASIARELAPTREAYRNAILFILVFSVLAALLFGAFFTAQLVRPLRRIIRQVEKIGAGSYDARIDVRRDDELGRLASAVNKMAADVAVSFERIQSADTLRRKLIANVGHDLRTPLSVLLGQIEEAERLVDTEQQDEIRSRLSAAARQGKYLNELINDLFELSLLDNSSPPLRREPVPLSELLYDAANGHRNLFAKAGLNFVLDIPHDLPVIQGDGVRLLRLVDNLLSNARRHTLPGGRVILRASTAVNHVAIEISDTGPGMKEDVLERIFDYHIRGKDARTRNAEGTGLGLPISRAIARAHHGDLIAQSTPGEGSTFIFRLPMTVNDTSDLTPKREE